MLFEIAAEEAQFHSPLLGGALHTERIQRRTDPLTGQVVLCAESLKTKTQIFLGPTDHGLLEAMARETRPGCFFCPERVETMTPRYPDNLIAGGRVRSGESVLFPNLFPLARIHAVAVAGREHYVPLGKWDAKTISDTFRVCLTLIGAVARKDASIAALTVNCNFLFPAGASLVHPHFQVFGGTGISSGLRRQFLLEQEFYLRQGQAFLSALTDEERQRGERYIGATGGCHWLAAFAPSGTNEMLGVFPELAALTELGDVEINDLAQGLVRLLRFYSDRGYSSFNFSLSAGLLHERAPWSRVRLRLITRQNAAVAYRSDDYFLQKLLGDELVLEQPEDLASAARSYLAGGSPQPSSVAADV